MQRPTYEDQAKGKTSRITGNLQNQAEHLKAKLAGPERAAVSQLRQLTVPLEES